MTLSWLFNDWPCEYYRENFTYQAYLSIWFYKNISKPLAIRPFKASKLFKTYSSWSKMITNKDVIGRVVSVWILFSLKQKLKIIFTLNNLKKGATKTWFPSKITCKKLVKSDCRLLKFKKQILLIKEKLLIVNLENTFELKHEKY